VVKKITVVLTEPVLFYTKLKSKFGKYVCVVFFHNPLRLDD